ncbi:MAG: 1-acyl-sn-glycerol-3-phosphate acyltransferase [Rickettsiales bacterium]|nr:1-acyl-sn-glycerol-3-phosphate acyltransferase [Rickettsiales bacterium]
MLLTLLRYICKINVKIIDKGNIPAYPFIVASKHQSALETLALHLLFSESIFVLKRELLFIPIVGIYLKNIGSIVINRAKGRSAILHIKKQLLELSDKTSLIIFPEGTRTIAGEYTKGYNSGIAMIYEELKWPILPVALNTGLFWPKRGAMCSGIATIKILPAIKPSEDYNRKQFLQHLNEIIESESIHLYKNTVC